MEKLHSWEKIEVEQMNPLLTRQLITGEQVMLARIVLKKGCVVPEHYHHNEQVSSTLKGALKFTLEGREVIVHAGEVLCIPPNVRHMAEALEDTIALDVFTPPRQDWLDKKDDYLRGK